jgi:hypothetical protein
MRGAAYEAAGQMQNAAMIKSENRVNGSDFMTSPFVARGFSSTGNKKSHLHRRKHGFLKLQMHSDF